LPVNGFSVGRDYMIAINGPGGTTAVIPSSQITNFTKSPKKREDWSRPLNLPPIPLYVPDGWQGGCSIDREDNTLDTFQASNEANFWAGQSVLSGTIIESVTEPSGTVSQFRYDDVMFWVSNPGSATVDRKVEQHLEWCSGTRKRIS
jgi:hypothetical protein